MARTAALIAVLLLVAVPDAQARVGCGSGTTAFVQGDLRIFGVHFRTPDEFGFLEYACLGRGRRPLLVGGRGGSTGLASSDTPAYATGGGGRFLAAYETSDGEGGPSASLTVSDLRTRRTVNYLNLACCEGVPAFRVADDGTVVVLAPGEHVLVKARGRRARVLSEGTPRDLAVAGSTIYWSENGAARSAPLGGTVRNTDAMLEPVRLRRSGGACAAARGRTVAASGSVRVVERRDGRFACRLGRAGRFDAGVPRTPAPRIVGDRWLLVAGVETVRVVDSRTGRTVTEAGRAGPAVLLADGTLAWLDGAGRLRAQRPGEPPIELAGAGATRLAAARRAVYWTEAGLPRRYPPVSAARSASKPG